MPLHLSHARALSRLIVLSSLASISCSTDHGKTSRHNNRVDTSQTVMEPNPQTERDVDNKASLRDVIPYVLSSAGEASNPNANAAERDVGEMRLRDALTRLQNWYDFAGQGWLGPTRANLSGQTGQQGPPAR